DQQLDEWKAAAIRTGHRILLFLSRTTLHNLVSRQTASEEDRHRRSAPARLKLVRRRIGVDEVLLTGIKRCRVGLSEADMAIAVQLIEPAGQARGVEVPVHEREAVCTRIGADLPAGINHDDNV